MKTAIGSGLIGVSRRHRSFSRGAPRRRRAAISRIAATRMRNPSGAAKAAAFSASVGSRNANAGMASNAATQSRCLATTAGPIRSNKVVQRRARLILKRQIAGDVAAGDRCQGLGGDSLRGRDIAASIRLARLEFRFPAACHIEFEKYAIKAMHYDCFPHANSGGVKRFGKWQILK